MVSSSSEGLITGALLARVGVGAVSVYPGIIDSIPLVAGAGGMGVWGLGLGAGIP